MKRKGYSQEFLPLVKALGKNKDTILTTSLVLYAAFYLAAGIGGITFQIQPAIGYHQDTGPSEPINPSPVDGAITEASSISISAEYNDPDGDDGTLTFYDGAGSEIVSCPVTDGDRCSVSWSGYTHGENEWYAVADDDGHGEPATGDTWNLIKNQEPAVESLDSPPDGSTVYGESVQLEATVSDPDGNLDTLTVTFYNNKTGDIIDTDTVTGDTAGTTASVEWSGLTRGNSHEWHVTVTDGWESDQSDTNSSFYVNALPNVNRIHPEDGGLAPNDPVNLWTIAEDPDTDDPVTVYFFNASDDTLIGKDSTGTDLNASTEWSGLEQGTIYSWYVNASDGNENLTSLTWSFKRSLAENFRARVRIQYRYTHIIASPENPSYFFFTVENRVDEPKNLNTTLSGVNAEFVGDGWREYTLEGNSEKRFQVRVAPETTGSDLELSITTENQQFGLTQTETIPVYSRETVAASMSREVPGIGLLQLLAIGLLSTVLVSASL